MMPLMVFIHTELNAYDPRARPGQKNARAEEAYARNRKNNHDANVALVPTRAQRDGGGQWGADKDATFGQRCAGKRTGAPARASEGAVEMSWIPLQNVDAEDTLVPGGGGKRKECRKGVETFGAGMEKGGEDPGREVGEHECKGRTEQRRGIRSRSKNTFRRM